MVEIVSDTIARTVRYVIDRSAKNKSPDNFGACSTLHAQRMPASSQILQRIAVRFEGANTLLKLNDVARFRQIGFATLTLRGFEPVAQFFDDVRNHDALQGSLRSPVNHFRDIPYRVIPNYSESAPRS
ncbi:hypothetical protein BGL_1c27350 [Burkholderia plantarii]|uniref:Uncharacterized protein n=1 Tax=Burkholderia plantarii TaxID=41899 RepID=A0A0B6RYH8_BURPL|nr:hypothetical protein BGL_1c27350 [Burkholderia plantarii]